MENEWDNQIEIIGFVKSASAAPMLELLILVRNNLKRDDRYDII